MKLLKQILGLLPTRTPIGRTEFDTWSVSIFSTYNLPSTPGYRQALCTFLMQEKNLYVPKFKFAKLLRKGQVNETAYQLMKEIQEEKKKVLAAEDTPAINGVSNGAITQTVQ